MHSYIQLSGWSVCLHFYSAHWNENVVILTKFSSLAALKVVILTTFSAASDEDFIKMKTFPFQCWLVYLFVPRIVRLTRWSFCLQCYPGESLVFCRQLYSAEWLICSASAFSSWLVGLSVYHIIELMSKLSNPSFPSYSKLCDRSFLIYLCVVKLHLILEASLFLLHMCKSVMWERLSWNVIITCAHHQPGPGFYRWSSHWRRHYMCNTSPIG